MKKLIDKIERMIAKKDVDDFEVSAIESQRTTIESKDGKEDFEQNGSEKKSFKSVDVQCTIQGMTISAYTVDDCMNTTASQVDYINYPWNMCSYDSKAQLYVKVLGGYDTGSFKN